MGKEEIGQAIVNAADKDFSSFKKNIGGEIEDRLGTAIRSKSAEVKENLFGAPPEPPPEPED